MPPPQASVRPPSQARSRRTLERLLAATETLLESRPFHDLPVSEIVRAARTSVGAFYTRFADKDALLTALYAHYDEGLPERVVAWCESHGPAPTDLPGAALWVAGFLFDSMAERRNLLRALALHVRLHPEVVDEAARSRRAAQHRFLVAALAQAGADPTDAETALYFAASAVRERVLFSESTHARSFPRSDTELVRDTARLIASYVRPSPELAT